MNNFLKNPLFSIKFIYSEKATEFCEIFTLLLTGTTQNESKVKILQSFVAFSEYMNFSSKDKHDTFCVVSFQGLKNDLA